MVGKTMPLTSEQRTTLRNDILADPALAALPASADNADAIATAYKVTVTPAFIVWRSDVKASEIGDAWVGTDIDGMSALNMQRLQLLLGSSPQGVFDMRRIDRRAGFENPFGTNVSNASRVAMRASWKRSANRLEKLFATGTGSDASPATMVVEGSVSYQEIQLVMGWA
jgi:hypothetical protein